MPISTEITDTDIELTVTSFLSLNNREVSREQAASISVGALKLREIPTLDIAKSLFHASEAVQSNSEAIDSYFRKPESDKSAFASTQKPFVTCPVGEMVSDGVPGRAMWEERADPSRRNFCGVKNKEGKLHGTMWGSIGYDIHKELMYLVGDVMGIWPGSRLLDAGSGCGQNTDMFARHFGANSVGVDFSKNGVAYARQHYAGQHCVGSVVDMGWLRDSSFDFVVTFGVIGPFAPPQMCAALTQMVRVLRPGGLLWFAMVNSRADVKAECASVVTSDVVKCFHAMPASVHGLRGTPGTINVVPEVTLPGVKEWCSDTRYSVFYQK